MLFERILLLDTKHWSTCMTDGLKWQIQQCVATRFLLPCALDQYLVPQNILALKDPVGSVFVCSLGPNGYSRTSEQRTLWEWSFVISSEVVPISEVHHILIYIHI